MEALFYCDPFKIDPVLNTILNNDDLFRHYIINEAGLNYAMNLFGATRKPLLLNKYNEIYINNDDLIKENQISI